MKKILLVILLFATSWLYSQINGVKFTSNKTVYKHNFSAQIGAGPSNPNPPITYKYYRYFVNGDSVSGGNYYQKLYFSPNTIFDTICNPPVFYGLMHYAGNKLFVGSNLIYDFNLAVNDTFGMNVYVTTTMGSGWHHYVYTASLKDSVYLGSKWRKRIQFTSPLKPWTVPQITWVEGVGDLNYGFNCDYSEVQASLIHWAGSHPYLCFYENTLNNFGSDCSVVSFCGTNNSSSYISCDGTPGAVIFSVASGTAPYTYSVQPPSSCSIPDYTITTVSSGTTLPLSCAGVYTFIVRDSGNKLIGLTTHTVNEATAIGLPVSSSKDTVCAGESITLSIPLSGPGYTISQVSWSHGTGSPLTITTGTGTGVMNYSLTTALYTTASSKTCTVFGSGFVVINACVGINELNFDSTPDFLAYPNPASEQIYLQSPDKIITGCSIISYNGKEIELGLDQNIADLSSFPDGLYILKLKFNEGIIHKKIVLLKNK